MIGNTYLMKIIIQMNAWKRVAHGEVVDKAIMDFVVVSGQLGRDS